MKKLISYILLAILLACGIFVLFSFKATSENPTSDSERKARELLKTLSLADKVGEMTQLSIDVLSVGEPYNLKEPHTLDEEKLKKVLVDLRVGSIMNVGGHAYTRAEWQNIIETIQHYATKEKPSGIPVLYGIDAVHGTNYTVGATLFPQQLALAATWNPDLAHRMGEVTAYETRASGIPWTFSPVMDIGRDQRWPRLWESFGEDVLLASEMGKSIVKGYQGDQMSHSQKVSVCLKHFIGYSTPRTGKDRTPAYIPERYLQEYFIPPFKAAMDAGALTVMINSGDVNGIPTHVNPRILKDLLREQLGFRGIALTDWEDIGLLVSRHRVAHDFREAIKMSINAGIDMAMVPMDTEFPVILKELVESGEIPMERIDEAVTRILMVKYELGLFDNPYYPFEEYDEFGAEQHKQAALEAARESIVLLKNEENILPLSTSSNVLLTGPNADDLMALNGGWSGTWQGADPAYSTRGRRTVREAIQQKIGNRLTYVPGTGFDKEINIREAVEASKGKDVAIVCIGEKPYTEIVGSIEDMRLPQAQYDLVEKLAETGIPIVLVLVEGRPRIVQNIEPHAKGVIGAFLPGDFGGEALADVLFGAVNPSGKLPITYPRYSNSLLTYDHKGTELVSQDFGMQAFNPQWEFGHGLGYAPFAYSDLKVSKPVLKNESGDEIVISVKIKNTGNRAGKEVVQLYITDMVATITPPVKRLRGFDKITLEAGEEKEVRFTIGPEDLAFVGMHNKWVTEPGEFTIHLAGLTADFQVVGSE